MRFIHHQFKIKRLFNISSNIILRFPTVNRVLKGIGGLTPDGFLSIHVISGHHYDISDSR